MNTLARRPESEAAPAENLVLMFERLAKDPAVDVEKLERLIGMQERIRAAAAKAAFDADYSLMQGELPVIDERGEIPDKSGRVRSTFAPLDDIHEIVKPIMQRFGFAIRHRTEWPADKPKTIRVIGILSHQYGHREESVFEAALDRSEFRSEIQSQGSTVSYGRRYTTLDLLNIATRGGDTDGNKPKPGAEPRREVKRQEGIGDKLKAAAAAVMNEIKITAPACVQDVTSTSDNRGEVWLLALAGDPNIYRTRNATQALGLEQFKGTPHKIRVSYKTAEWRGELYHNIENFAIADAPPPGAAPADLLDPRD